MRITVFCGPYPVDEHLGGTGLRMWELAQVLAGDGADVSLVVPRPSTFTWPGITVSTFAEDTWPGLIAGSGAVITTDLPDTRLLLHAYHCGVLTIVENAPPIEHLHYAELRAAPDPQALYDELADRYRFQLLVADHLLVRSGPERASTLGALVATGRLGWLHQRQSPAMRHLLTLLPVGFNQPSAARAAAAVPGMPVDLAWNGGIWDYCEPSPLWPALALLRDEGRPLSLRLLYPPTRDAITTAVRQHGLDGLVRVPGEPVAHHERDGLLLAARAIVCTGRDGAETQTCHRLRLRDAFLYRLPVIIDHYGASADLVAQHRIGAVADPRDTAALAAALAAAARDGAARDGYLDALGTARDRFTFEAHMTGLRDFLAAGRHAPDIGTRRHQEALADLLLRRPLLADTPTRLLLGAIVTPAPAITSLSMLTCTAPAFPACPGAAISLGDWDRIPDTAAREVAASMTAAGYALVQADAIPGPGTAAQVAVRLGLGPAFTPPQYRNRPYVADDGVTRITADATTTAHPAFGQVTGQRLHADGTLQRLGEIKTTLMLCARPAPSGGASRLFNSAGAFAALLGTDPAAAAALTAPEVLVRTSSLHGNQGQSAAGPAFALADGQVISRYSVTGTDAYDPGAVADPAALDRALAFLNDAARPGTGFYAEVTLAADQGLLLANDMISHGRAPYHDDPAAPRLIYRALFTTRCAITKAAA